MKRFTRFVALILCVTMFFSLVACGGDHSFILTDKDGEQTASSIYVMNLIAAFNNAVSTLGDNVVGTDYFLNVIDGKTLKDWCVDEAVSATQYQMAVEKQFDALGLSLDEETVTSYKEQCQEEFDSNSAYYSSLGITAEDLIFYQMATLKQDAIFNHFYGEDGPEAVTEEEKMNYLTENFGLVLTLAEGTASMEEDVVADKKEALKSYVEQLNLGEAKFVDLVRSYYYFGADEETIKELEEAAGDSAPTFTEAQYQQLVDITIENDELVELIKTTPAGEAFYFEDENHIRLVVVQDVTKDETILESYASAAPYMLRAESFQGKLDQWVEEMGFALNKAAVSKFDIQKIVNGKFDL